jgi:hypothetical protein
MSLWTLLSVNVVLSVLGLAMLIWIGVSTNERRVFRFSSQPAVARI